MKFVCKRSLRQGDPLSPLLFVLVVDVFSRMLNKGRSLGLIEGLGPSDYNITNLQFADDTIFFLLFVSKLRNLKVLS